MKNKKERYIFCPRLLDIADDILKLSKIEKTNNKLSNKTKINILRHYTEWLIIDFMYRTLIGKDKKYKTYQEVVESFNHKKVAKIFEIWNKEKIINKNKTQELKKAWKESFVKVYHHKFSYIPNPLAKEYEYLYDLISELSTKLKKYWLNMEIIFTNNENSNYKNLSHFVYENIIICKSKEDTVRDYHTPLVKIKVKNLINKHLLKQKTNRLTIVEKDINLKICYFCVKRIFGIDQKSDDIDYKNLNNYLRREIKKPYK